MFVTYDAPGMKDVIGVKVIILITYVLLVTINKILI